MKIRSLKSTAFAAINTSANALEPSTSKTRLLRQSTKVRKNDAAIVVKSTGPADTKWERKQMWEYMQFMQVPLLWATAIFGVFGVTSGFLSGIIGYQLSKESDLKIALATSAAATANERAELAKQEIAVASVHAAEANKLAAEANERAAKASLELERFRAPRILSKKAIALMPSILSKFIDTKFAIAIPANNKEIENFALQIEEGLTSSKWMSTPWIGGDIELSRPNKASWGLASAEGLVLEFHESQKDRLFPVAIALGTILKDDGFNVNISNARLTFPKMEDVLKIIVGNKQ